MSWNCIIDNQIQKENIDKKLSEIYKYLSSEYYTSRDMGVLSGKGSVLLFCNEFQKYTKKSEHNDKFYELLSLYYEQFFSIYKNILNNNLLYSMNTWSFCNGYAGIGWMLRFMTKEGVIESTCIDDVLSEIDALIVEIMKLCCQYKNFDYLHGGTGIALYLATIESNIYDDKTDLFLESLYKSKFVTDSGGYGWLQRTIIEGVDIGDVYNQSLSHGMAAIMAILTKMLNRKTSALAEDLLIGILKWYEENKYNEEYSITFPKWVSKNVKCPEDYHISWCYGDLGIAQALYRAGKTLKNNVAEELALHALQKVATKQDGNFLKDACFCHGSSGLAYIFNRLYQSTRSNCFKEAALFWLNDVLYKGNNNLGNVGYSFYGKPSVGSTLGLLSGLSGVGLSLLSFVSENDPTWDECVLLT